MTETTTATVPAPRDEQAPEAQPGHGGKLIAALESTWAAIKANHADVPDVVMITGTQKQHGGDRWGHYGADHWAVPEEDKGRRAPELFIAGEAIAKGGRWVLEVLLHEASHGVAHTRGIKDCSGDGNRYHNKRFVAIAEELGLQGPKESVKTHGWAFCSMPSATAARYAEVIEELDTARLPYRGIPAVTVPEDEDQENGEDGAEDGEEKPKKKRAGRRLGVICQCVTPEGKPRRRLQLTPKSLEDGPIICGNCREEFTPEEPDEDDDE